MIYLLYKLKFPNGIHVGVNSSLELTSTTVSSDVFYSAFYAEYIRIFGENDRELFQLTENDEFKVSDLLPFKEKKTETFFYVPKPFVNDIERKQNNDENEQVVDRKKVKKLSYIPASRLNEYFEFLETGKNFPEIDDDFGEKELHTKNKVSRIGEDTELYNVEVFRFNKESGLYFIVQLPEKWQEKFENVLESLSLAGIGGKKSAGYGQFSITDDAMVFDGEYFDIIKSEDDRFINESLYKESEKYLLLSSYLPQKDEIEKIKNKENGYQLIKRSGFVNSPKYSENPQKRKQVYMISSGAVLNFKPAGRLADLKLHGNHSIYRMGKPIAIGVTYGKDS